MLSLEHKKKISDVELCYVCPCGKGCVCGGGKVNAVFV